MKKSRYKEEQIIAVLKEVDAGAKVQDVIRRLGETEQTYYRWKAKFGGMEVSDVVQTTSSRTPPESPTSPRHILIKGQRPGWASSQAATARRRAGRWTIS